MNVIVLQVFVSLMLVVSSVLLYAFSVRHRDYEHSDRLALIPLEEDDARASRAEPPGHSSPQQ